MTRSRAVAALAALLLSCKVDVSVPAGAELSCSTSSECPDGFVCHAHRCSATGAVDTTPPDLAGAVEVSPALARAGQTITVAFGVTEPLAVPARVTLGLDTPVQLDCTATGTTAYTCSYTTTGDENGGAGGRVDVDVWLRDAGWNETVRQRAASVRLDFAVPAVTTAVAVYRPAPGSPLARVERAAAGATIEVAVSANELLDGTAAPELVAAYGATSLQFTLDPARLGPATAVFEAVVPAGAPDGDYAATVTWSDLAGNRDAVPVPDLAVRVKTSAPALAVDQAAVTFLRSPWGNAGEEDLGGFVVPAGPYFALAPADPLSPAASIPAGTFSAPGATPALLRVWADGGTRSLLGSTPPRGDGAWPRARLANLDTPEAWVTLVDDAGNESAPVRLVHSEWIATAAAPAWGSSPHAVDASVYLVEALVPAEDTAVPVPPGLDGLGGASAVVRAQGTFRRLGGATPSARRNAAMVHDTVRDQLVLYGGTAPDGTTLSDTWVFDGQAWRSSTPTPNPGPRYGHVMAFDAARGRTILYGGMGPTGSAATETWEWDGAVWKSVGGNGATPGHRYAAGMAWDAGHRRAVLFGGSTDSALMWTTWAWDGAAWTKLAIPDLTPERIYTAMAYDPVRGVVVLYAGSNPRGASWLGDVRELRDDGWHDVTPAAGAPRPDPRYFHALAWDPVRRKVVLFGGLASEGASAEVWTWDGAAWAGPLAATGPAARSRHAMAAARGRLWVVGGYDASSATLGDLWTLDGFGTWREATGGPTPPGRAGHAMAYDPVRGRTVMVGGEFQADVWEWNGARWFDVTPAAGPTPGSPVDHAMAWDPVEQRVVLTGGWDGAGYLTGAWDWNGTGWRNRTLAAGSPVPGVSFGSALAHDPLRNRLVQWGMFGSNAAWELAGPAGGPWSWTSATPASAPHWRGGVSLFHDGARLVAAFGDGGDACYAELWTWNGSAWSPVASGVAPGPRGWQMMAWDGAAEHALLFGGLPEDGGPYGDVWRWKDGAFSRIERPPAAAWPSARSHGAMAYDSARGRMVLFGGTEAASSGGTFDPGHAETFDRATWEWDLDAAPSAAGPVQVRAPMVQFTASLVPAGFLPGAATGLRVRARAGATVGAGAGARLLGWRGASGWEELTSGTAGTPLAAAPAGMLAWSAPAGTLPDFLAGEADGQLAFQLRPAGAPGVADPEAVIEADYLEVRVRYDAE